MDNRKLRIAFAKVKKDILELKEKVDDLSKQKTTKKEDFDKNKIDNFIKNVEEELNSLRLVTRELEDKVEYKLNKNSGSTNDTKIDKKIKEIQNEQKDFNELIHEKIDMELNSLRLELTEEIAKVYDRVTDNKSKKQDKTKTKKTKEKKNKEDKIKEDKTKKEQIKPKEKKENKLQKEENNTKNKKSKFKKAMNWLFIDEEEQENENMNDIKSEVKKNKN